MSGPGERIAKDADAGYVERRIRRQHVIVAVAAAAISLTLHTLMVAVFPQIRFQTLVRAIREKTWAPLRLERVEAEGTRTGGGTPTRYRAENPNLSAELPGEARAFQKGPDEVLVQPRMVPEAVRAAESRVLGRPEAAKEVSAWDPRQDILQLRDRAVAEDPRAKPRRLIPDIPRGPLAPDFVSPLDRNLLDRMAKGTDADFRRTGAPDGDIRTVVLGGAKEGGAPPVAMKDEPERRIAEAAAEAPAAVTGDLPLEKLLVARLTAYRSLRDFRHVYCRIEISRAGPEELPVLPRDVMLVQDCSASMTSQRMYFCRSGLIRCLLEIRPTDRFNILRFRDRPELCFPSWADPTAGNLDAARQFIGEMQAEGNTDIYGSIRALLEQPRTPGRPVIAAVVSDGLPTVGVTSSSRIVAQFSRDNAGAVSVFTMGTSLAANRYLLDLLSYCNRGDSAIVTRGRWDIPDVMEQRFRGLGHPVLTDVQVRFPRAGDFEAYPGQPSNLYMDRPLVLFCRVPRGTPRVVFQVAGQAGGKHCDMVFGLDVAAAPDGGDEIRTDWIWQKAYDRIAAHARTLDPAVVEELRRMARAYDIEIPYLDIRGGE